MRFVKDIEIEGKKVKALFDTGAINTYVIKDILKDVPIRTVREPYKVALAGKVIEVKQYCANDSINWVSFNFPSCLYIIVALFDIGSGFVVHSSVLL